MLVPCSGMCGLICGGDARVSSWLLLYWCLDEFDGGGGESADGLRRAGEDSDGAFVGGNVVDMMMVGIVRRFAAAAVAAAPVKGKGRGESGGVCLFAVLMSRLKAYARACAVGP